MTRQQIEKEISSLHFSLQMNERRTYADGLQYEKDSKRIKELESMLEKLKGAE